MSVKSQKTKLFTEVYSDYYSIVFSAVYAKVRNNKISEDICQEVFIRFFEKFDSIENHRKWLHGTLRLVVLEYYKSKNNTYNQSDVDEHFNNISLSYINGFRDLRIIITDAIEDMQNFKDEKDKTLFELVAICGLSYPETAAQLGLTTPQVKYKYNVILGKLIQYFQSKGIKSLEDLL